MKLWFRTTLATLAAISLFFIVGCTNPVEGKWRGTVFTTAQGPMETFLEFKPTGKMTMTSVSPIEVINDKPVGGGQKMIMEGTYSVQGNRLQGKLATASNGTITRTLPESLSKLDGTFKIEGDKLSWKFGPDDPETVFTRQKQ